jgi:hypothetical protein
MGINWPAPQSIQSGRGSRELEKFLAHIWYENAISSIELIAL